jgi:hypothetical protein
MMFVVHKIELQAGVGNYSLPIGSELLRGAIQHGKPMLWYKRPVQPAGFSNKILLLTGTGHDQEEAPAGARWNFISTMLTADQAFVFHLFELV